MKHLSLFAQGLLALLLTCWFSVSLAAEAEVEPPAEGEQQVPAEVAADQAQSPETAGTDGVDAAQPEAGEEEADEDEGPSRFIPTEQISQDLGVSFPANI